MQSSDRFYFSPDAGQLVERNGNYYTEDGYVLPANNPEAMIRLMPIDSCENYADWSDEHRQSVRQRYEDEVKRKQDAENLRRKNRDALVAQARTKLTEAEFDAVYDLGAQDERGY